MILIGYVLVIILCGQVVNALDCQSKDHRFKPHQLPQEKFLSPLGTQPRPM